LKPPFDVSSLFDTFSTLMLCIQIVPKEFAFHKSEGEAPGEGVSGAAFTYLNQQR